MAKIVIVDDIGLSDDELKKLKETLSNRNADKGKKDVVEFPTDFVNQTKPTNANNTPKEPTHNKDNPNFEKHGNENSKIPYFPNNSNSKNNKNGINERERIPENDKYPDMYDFRSKPDSDYFNKNTHPIQNSNSDYKDMINPNSIEDDERDLIRKERDNIIDAQKARSAFIDLKMNESRQREEQLNKKASDLRIKLDNITEKFKERKKEFEENKYNLMSLKNRKDNLLNNIRRNEIERDKNDASARLLNNEKAHLLKKLDDLESRALTLKNEIDVYNNRINDEKNDLNNVVKKYNAEEIKEGEYEKELNNLENIQTTLKNQEDDIATKKNREGSLQYKLEMERDRISRGGITLS